MSEFEKELEKKMKLGKVAYERESLDSDFLVSKRDIERIFEDWQPPKELVEVPQIVADFIKTLKIRGIKPLMDSATFGEIGFTEEKRDEILHWINEHQEEYMRAWPDGYTVEKKKLYILKHIDLSKSSSDDSLYLTHGIYKRLMHARYSKDVDISKVEECHFTQSEIDELNTGSYEQIEVKVEEDE